MNSEADDSNYLVAFDKETHNNDDTVPFVWKCLDEIEKRVEKLRDQAASIENEKEQLLFMLQDIQDKNSGDQTDIDGVKDEVEAMTERLICRCLTVEVKVTIPRNDQQEKALQRASELLHDLECELRAEKSKSLIKAEAYLNACLTEPSGPSIDQRFQGVVIECTADDQKIIRKRLTNLIKKYKKIKDVETAPITSNI